MTFPHPKPAPSAWILRWAHLAEAGASVLDLACGTGRHARWWAERGHAVLAVDRDTRALTSLRSAQPRLNTLTCLEADLEAAPWPLGQRQFGVIVVTNYLWRPLWPALVNALAPGGVLLYETFAVGQETMGRPSRPEFLLQAGELLQRCHDLRVVAFEDGFDVEAPRYVQRIAACREPAPAGAERRYALTSPRPSQG
jgi:SAM-dependent methyltransferase